MLCLALGAILAGGGQLAHAATPKGKRISRACASKRTGQLRGLIGSAVCGPAERPVDLQAGRVLACVQRDGTVRRVSAAARCRKSHPRRKALALPPAAGIVSFCARRGSARGRLRYLAPGHRCRVKERLELVSAPPRASGEAYVTSEDTPLTVGARGILANDASPSRRGITPTIVSPPAHAASFALRPDGSFSYRPAANYGGRDSFTYLVADGLASSSPATVAITVSPVNDAPVDSVPGTQRIEEDAPLVLARAHGNRISTSDIDAGGAAVQVTLTTTHGTVTLGRTSGVSFDSGDGTGDGAVAFRGTLANVDAALDGLRYQPDRDYNGSATLTIETNDLGNTGLGGAHTDTDHVSVTIAPVNDAPVDHLPAPQTADDLLGLTFSAAAGNTISVSDVDAGSAPMKVMLGVAHGKLTLARTTGLTFTSGMNGSGAMTFAGSLAALDAALEGLFYKPAPGSGSDTLSIVSDDQGATGAGGAHSDSDSLALTIAHVNVAPVNTVPGSQTTPAGTSLVFAAPTRKISTADSDAGTAPVKVTLGVAHGALTLSQTTGLTFLTGDGTADPALVFTGTLAHVNGALAGLVYTPASGYDGPDTLTFTTDDQGATGAGGAQHDTDTIAIAVQHINLAPVNAVPAAQSTPAATALVFAGAARTISTADADAAGSPVKVTLGVSHGTLTLSTTSGLSFATGDGTADAAMVFTGTLTNVNAALSGLTYLPASGYEGPDTLTFSTDDQGNTGVGGARSDTDTVAIAVQHVNQAPVNTVPGSVQTPADTSVVFSSAGAGAISVADADADGAALKVTLGVDHGTLTLAQTTGLSFSTGDGSADPALTFSGTLADIDAALDGLAYAPSTAYEGSDTLTITSDDQGASGLGGGKTDTDAVAITVQHVNAAPVNTVPDAQSTPLDTTLSFSGANANAISVADADAGSGAVKVMLAVDHGTLALAQTSGLSFTLGTGAGDASMTFTGSLASVDAALDGLAYTPSAGYTGTDTLTLTTDDQGNTGVGGGKQAVSTVAIAVGP